MSCGFVMSITAPQCHLVLLPTSPQACGKEHWVTLRSSDGNVFLSVSPNLQVSHSNMSYVGARFVFIYPGGLRGVVSKPHFAMDTHLPVLG